MYYNTNYLCVAFGVSWEGHRRDGWLGTTGCLSAVSFDIELCTVLRAASGTDSVICNVSVCQVWQLTARLVC